MPRLLQFVQGTGKGMLKSEGKRQGKGNCKGEGRALDGQGQGKGKAMEREI